MCLNEMIRQCLDTDFLGRATRGVSLRLTCLFDAYRDCSDIRW